MAIRYPKVTNATPMYSAISGGWSGFILNAGVGDSNTILAIASSQVFQPSKLIRPGNLGTAYIGAWTENVTSPNDTHIPIPFKIASASLVARRVMTALHLAR